MVVLVFWGLLVCDIKAQSPEVIDIWPDGVPGQTAPKAAPDARMEGNSVKILTNVTHPILEVFRPHKEYVNGGAIIICPGGGYNVLAVNYEGYEIARWFNTLGYTAFVLQYRVPGSRDGALQDAQRALRIVRSRSNEWGINSSKIGIMGFSAGGSLSARLSCLYNDDLYPVVDASDGVSARPDFTMLIYPAYLDEGQNKSVTKELRLTGELPPMFMFGTHDDSHGNSVLSMASGLREVKVPVELHYAAEGGHGYGLRMGNPSGEAWPLLAETWLSRIIPPIEARKNVKTIVCIGNSITEGDGLYDRFAEAWPYVLQQKLGAPYRVLNYGKSGKTMLKKGDSSYWDDNAFKNALSSEPDIVIIKLGTNDSKPQYWSDIQTFTKDYSDMIRAFKELPSKPEIYICTPVPAFSSGWDISEKVITKEQVPIIKKLAAKEKVKLIDLYSEFAGKKQLFPDGIHPGKEGAEQMADVIYKVINK